MRYSVVIPTYNRAADLREALTSLAQIRSPGDWEVIVVDNNSTDTTPQTVAEFAEGFPVPLRYVQEPVQGISAALNTGVLSASGELIALSNDDCRFDPDWLVNATQALARFDCSYVGGKILPFWQGTPPSWVSLDSARQRAVLGLVNYPTAYFEFGTNPVVGGNLVVRREVFDRVGLWNPEFGRKAGTLLGQEMREWCLRVHKAGLRGVYIPEMVVYHLVPADRLTRQYFCRWFYWHGISRAMLYQRLGLDMESPERSELDFSSVPHVAGVPRYLYRTALNSLGKVVGRVLRRDTAAAFDELLWVFFFVGIVRQRWKERGLSSIPPRADSMSGNDAIEIVPSDITNR